ncbi:MAG: aconitase/3-isopropylmalate dehydratase large subunit family protein, partial [Candidatus Omnitrophota bacterium]
TCTYGAVGAFSTGSGSTDLACAWITGRMWLRVPQSMKFLFSGKLNRWVGGKDLILHTIADIGVSGALYKAMEFGGPVIRNLSIEDRFTMCNMAIEAGGKSGIIEPDEITEKYLRTVLSSVYPKQTHTKSVEADLCVRPIICRGGPCARPLLKSDKDAHYCDIREYDVTKLEPQVACPHLPSAVKPVGELKDVRIDQAVIGSCTNGRLADLRIAASVLKGHKADPRVRLLIFPGTQQIYRAALKEGLVEIFVKANGVVAPPTCGPCLGGHMGVLAEKETAIATTNRNFRGRMGALSSNVYLANPAVTAASAIKGRIAHPEEI